MGYGTGHRREAHRGGAQQDRRGGRENRATTPWDWGTSCHGVVSEWATMKSLATGSRENALNSGTAVRCPQGLEVTLRSPGKWPEYT